MNIPWSGKSPRDPWSANAGTRTLAKSVPINAEDIDALTVFVRENDIELTVVGPEDPLVKGIANIFEKKGLKAFGPGKAAVRFEGNVDEKVRSLA